MRIAEEYWVGSTQAGLMWEFMYLYVYTFLLAEFMWCLPVSTFGMW